MTGLCGIYGFLIVGVAIGFYLGVEFILWKLRS